MSDMTIKAEFFGGTPIEHAARESCRVATSLRCNIEFQFNGVTCFAQPYGDAQTLVDEFHKAPKDSGRHPMAFGRPLPLRKVPETEGSQS